MLEPEPAVEPWLDPLWERVALDWDDEAAHQAILVLCDSPERLAAAARRYREASRDPLKAPLAKTQLARITGLAFGHLTPPARPKEGGHTWKIVWLLLLLAAIAAVLSRS